jgi:arabinofuranosyltransferase
MRKRKISYLIIVLALMTAIYHQSLFLSWTSDDAFISYRYAENLSRGKGLVFNPGERVEGFSNFLWTLVLALFSFIGLSPLWVSKTISFCFSLLIIFFTYKTAIAYGLDKSASSICSLILAFSSSLAYYAMSGLETVFYSFLLLLAVFINKRYEEEPTLKYFASLYIILLLISLTRPEGLLFLLVSLLYFPIINLFKTGIKLKKILIAQISFFSVYALFISLRMWYYSDIFPNTFYAKPQGTFGESGYSVLFSNLSNSLLSGSFLLIPLPFLLLRKKYMYRNFFPLMFCVAQLFFMSYAGDWMAFGRFFFPILPIVIILFFSSLSSVRLTFTTSKSKIFHPLLYIIILFIFSASNAYQTERTLTSQDEFPFTVMNSSQLVHLGKWLKQNFPPETVISLRRQGAIPYYSEMKSIDFLGLTEKNIAEIIYREKDIQKRSLRSAEYIFNLKPDIIILFSFKSDFEGWILNDSFPEDKLSYLELTIYNCAKGRGYKHMKYICVGKTEKAHILVSSEPM